MFGKFNALMDRCKNSDQSGSMHVDVTNTDLTDPVKAREAWESLMRSSFEVKIGHIRLTYSKIHNILTWTKDRQLIILATIVQLSGVYIKE